jgi:hypothetical protein
MVFLKERKKGMKRDTGELYVCFGLLISASSSHDYSKNDNTTESLYKVKNLILVSCLDASIKCFLFKQLTNDFH